MHKERVSHSRHVEDPIDKNEDFFGDLREELPPEQDFDKDFHLSISKDEDQAPEEKFEIHEENLDVQQNSKNSQSHENELDKAVVLEPEEDSAVHRNEKDNIDFMKELEKEEKLSVTRAKDIEKVEPKVELNFEKELQVAEKVNKDKFTEHKENANNYNQHGLSPQGTEKVINPVAVTADSKNQFSPHPELELPKCDFQQEQSTVRCCDGCILL